MKQVKADCHTDRKHYANTLCKNCYMVLWKYKKRRAAGVSIRRKKAIRNFLVYVYYDLIKNIAVYVGRGKIGRAKEHKYSYKSYKKDWWNPNLLLITMTCEDEWQAMEWEGKWGGYYHPIMNLEGNRSGSDRN